MIVFGAQYNGSSHRANGDRILSLQIYERFAKDISEIINGKVGDEYILMAIKTENKEEIIEFMNETENETKKRLLKMMNAIIGEISEINGIDKDKYREQVKTVLKKRGFITQSTTELNADKLLLITSELKKKLYELKN